VSWSLVTLGLASKNEALLQALWKRAIETDERELEAVLSSRCAHEGERSGVAARAARSKEDNDPGGQC